MMMGGQALPLNYNSNGERIYFTGISASGDAIRFSGGNMHLRMMGGGCATCHAADRSGGRMMPEFWKVAPPLTRDALFEGHADGDGHGDHGSYDEATLRRAVVQGTDPAGQPLDEAMPRWSMSKRDWRDLFDYLKS
jgi:mono/diheme cytochrome c family protein